MTTTARRPHTARAVALTLSLALLAVLLPPLVPRAAAAEAPWSGTVTLTSTKSTLTSLDSSFILTATVSSPVQYPDYLTIYNQDGAQIGRCSGAECGPDGKTLTVPLGDIGANNAASYIASVSPHNYWSTRPGDGSALKAYDEVMVVHEGWNGNVSLEATPSADGTHTSLTATVDTPLTYPYRIGIYDGGGWMHASCTGTSCDSNTSLSTSLPSSWGDFFAVVSAEPSRGTNATIDNAIDIRATTGAHAIDNRQSAGWHGDVTMTSAVDPSNGLVTLTAKTSEPITSGFYLSIYRDGTFLYQCGDLGVYACIGGTDLPWLIQEHPGADAQYTAHVSRDRPAYTVPYGDLRASSAPVTVQGSGPVGEGELDGGHNPSVACSQRCHGDPINSVTGEFWESNEDLALPGDIDLTLGRSFSTALKDEEGPFGHGWRSSLFMTAQEHSGAVTIRQENGSAVTFAESGGAFTAPPRVQATLERDGDRLVFSRDRDRFVFSGGQLVEVSNAIRTATITRSSSEVTIAEGGRSITLAVDDGLVRTATDHTGRTVSYAYTGRDLASVELADGTEVSYAYDDHKVTSITHANGGVTTNSYDDQNRVVKQVDPVGRELTFAYSPGQTSITNPDGAITVERHANGQVLSETIGHGTPEALTSTFVYGATNQVTVETDSAGRETRHSYDASGNKTSTTDALGHTTRYVHSGSDLVKETNPEGESVDYTYDASGNLLTSSSFGETTTYSYADGRVVSQTSPTGLVTSFAYDGSGYPSSITGPDGSTTWMTFDTLANMTSMTDPRGSGPGDPDFTTTYTYDAAGRITSQTDPLGSTTAVSHEDGEPSSITDALGATTSVQRDPAGQVTKIVDELGASTTFGYDAAGRQSVVTSPLGGTSEVVFNTAGRPATSREETGRTTTYFYNAAGREFASSDGYTGTSTIYDAAGRVSESVNQDGSRTTVKYDRADRPVTVTRDGKSVTAAYTAGRLTSLTRADGSALSWTYNADGQQTSHTTADGTVTTSEYTGGRLSSQTDASGRTTTYTYDAAGNLTSETYGDVTTTHDYDAAGRKTSTSYSDGTPTKSFTYDDVGRLASMDDETGLTTYQRDLAGRLTQVDGEQTVTYERDAAGNPTTIGYPAGDVTHTYDSAGRMKSTTDWEGGAYSFDWNIYGQTKTTYPNGIEVKTPRKVFGQATSVKANGIIDIAYGYSAGGLMTSAGQHGYTWDSLDRLTGDSGEGIEFDPAGRIAALYDRTMTYDAQGQLASMDGPAPVSYTYDDRGNRLTSQTGDQTLTHTYDGANQLTSVGDTVYTYTGDGLRHSATTSEETETFLWDTSADVPLLLADGENSYVYGPTGTPLAQIGDDTQYLLADALGSVISTTDETGAVTSTMIYDAYGSPTGTPVTRFGFAGEYTDPTGYIYLRARYYDPQSAQFLSRDPIEILTQSAYDYTSGNPLQMVDPLGLWGWNPLKWSKDNWATVGKAATEVAKYAGYAALAATAASVVVASGGTAAVALTGIASVTGALSTSASAVSTVVECADGGAVYHCVRSAGITAIGVVGFVRSSNIDTFISSARRVSDTSIARLQAEVLGWSAASPLADEYEKAYGRINGCSP